MSEILIRAREPTDMADLTELLNQPKAIWGTLQMPFVSLGARQRRAAAGSAADLHLMAVIDGKVIGSASLNRFENRRAHAGSIGMAVHDAYAGRGAGSALMAAIIGQADNWLNLTRLELNVWSDNGRAIALYERFGFEREGLFRNYAWRDGAYADSIAMARLRG
ncbi:GNAT family N-acetyltransferase [Phenylobacterium sp.]|uniref:GNAT family N-acetyltransferase n=1 Tax=Phenylobacterium sp. TaxID=1871053 RepID=UPI00271CD4D5|nr:GNAT family N-acetyltransferase [Phenylobacterium sp.]MDO8379175.1 GNAT family N-acetyltransferase [Phenylobacterium sp.]